LFITVFFFDCPGLRFSAFPQLKNISVLSFFFVIFNSSFRTAEWHFSKSLFARF
jgi:hypothetical protein